MGIIDIYTVGYSASFRQAIESIIFHIILNFRLDNFNFDPTENVNLFSSVGDVSANSDILRKTRIYSDVQGAYLIQIFVIRAEFAHFLWFQKKHSAEYTWKTYLAQFEKSADNLSELKHAVLDGISQLDFKDTQPWKDLYKILSDSYDQMNQS